VTLAVSRACVVQALGQINHHHSSKQEIALRHRQNVSRFAGNQFAVDAHLVGLRVDGDVRLQALWIMSAFFTVRQPFTTAVALCRLSCCGMVRTGGLRDKRQPWRGARRPASGGNAPAAAWGLKR
jgi:hypothetical protein